MTEIVIGFALTISGLLGSGLLFRHQRILTYLATAAVLAEAEWLFLTLLARTIFTTINPVVVFASGTTLFLIICLMFLKSWHWPVNKNVLMSGRDIWVLLAILPTLLSCLLIFQFNSFTSDSWLIHGFFNGDTATFAALVNRSLTNNHLWQTNPFAGNGPLEYPTLVHAGLASFLTLLHLDSNWLSRLPIITVIQLLLTIPLFFVLFDTVFPEPPEQWRRWFGVPSRLAIYALQTVIVLYAMGLAWDMYVYPQSHFFLTGLFLLLVTCLWHSYHGRGVKPVATFFVAAVITFVLLLSNAIFGTTAIAMMVSFSLLRANDRSRAIGERGLFLGLIVIWIGVFLLALPGQAQFGHPDFSYTAALDMLRWSPAILLLCLAILVSFRQHLLLSSLTSVGMALAFFTFFFSQREIILDNASRFFYVAILIGFPLCLAPLIQVWYWVKRQLIYSTCSLAECVTGWVAISIVLALFSLPALASVASTHDHLMYSDEQTISPAIREALDWIQDNTLSDSVFVASVNPPWSIPYLTGRAQFRTDYWLSPNDDLLVQMQAAFFGDARAQLEVAKKADYVFLTETERASWENNSELQLRPSYKVFDNRAVVIYRFPL